MNIAETLYQSPTFFGKIKFIFTVEEEVGLVGARNVDETFLWGTDAAIVVDRRGTGDIVTSCGGHIPFCEEAYGRLIEQAAMEAGLSGWNVPKVEVVIQGFGLNMEFKVLTFLLDTTMNIVMMNIWMFRLVTARYN